MTCPVTPPINLATHIIPEVGLSTPAGLVACISAAGKTGIWDSQLDFLGYTNASSIDARFSSIYTITDSAFIYDRYRRLAFTGRQSGDILSLTFSTYYDTDYDVKVGLYYRINSGSWITLKSPSRRASGTDADTITGIDYNDVVDFRQYLEWGGSSGDGAYNDVNTEIISGILTTGNGTVTPTSPITWDTNKDFEI
jgi:hypothetical protein